ncbi:hypothetical protein DFH07DRAFT_958906 [Mycena maculata]|uniref:Uncharacterized protein n=1 Tax=Mycena maculata TaxID=230809 RepID=A0AAD7J4T8_9AGAR|nr:hypothetical protein DFH07DRAFT_958906 [Mycena maculata]
MSTSKRTTIPAGLKFNRVDEHPALKRKRQSSAGGDVVTQTSYSAAGKTATASSATRSGAQLPPQWRHICDEIAAANGAVPPPTVLAKFVELHSECLRDFRNAQTSLQKAVATSEKFAAASSTGGVHSSGSAAVKLPHVQVMKAAMGADDDPDVVAARTAAEKDISSASVSSTQYLAALYVAQVEAIRKKVHVTTVADGLAAAFTAYGQSIITSAGGTDLAVWKTVIARLKIVS